MDVSPNALRKETVQTLQEINVALDWIKNQPDIPSNRDSKLMIPALLSAKAQCLNTLTLLQGK